MTIQDEPAANPARAARLSEIDERRADGYDSASNGNAIQAAILMLNDINYLRSLPAKTASEIPHTAPSLSLVVVSEDRAEKADEPPLMVVRRALQMLLHNVRSVFDSEPPEASIPVQLRAGDIRQARAALRGTVEAAYAELQNSDRGMSDA